MDLKKLNEGLTRYIKPLSYPIAIKMLSSNDEIPKLAKTALGTFGNADMLCKSVTAARRNGWVMAVRKEDNVCTSVMECFGFYPLAPAYLEGEYQVPIHKTNKEARAKGRQGYLKFEYGKYSAMLIAPLFRAQSIFKDGFEPDVIVLYGFPAQIYHLAEGLSYEDIQGQIAGGACAGYLIKPMLTGKCHVVLPCGGDRIVGQAQDWEIIFSMPFNKVDLVMSCLEHTYKQGHRYPIPQQILFDSSALPPSYCQLRDAIVKYEKEYKEEEKKKKK